MGADTVAASPGHFRNFYTLGEQLGKGAYAVVFQCTHRETGNVYAVKVVDKTKAGPKDIDDITHEINVMGHIGYHPNVVQMFEYFSTERHLYIILDLLTGGMLFDRIVQLKHYSESDAATLVRNVLSGLAHIHSKGIIHRDLKPENLLLRNHASESSSLSSHLTDVCLADFGLAGYVPSTTCCGSPSYIAPEVINVGYYRTRKEPYDTKCDIWSIGVIAYILLSGRMPFHGRSFKETFECIVNNRWSYTGDTWDSVSPDAKKFIDACLTPDPVARPAASVLLNHRWMAESQSNTHLEGSLESLRKFNAQQKVRAAVRVFCWTQSLLGTLDWTPPFMRFLRHTDKYSTILTHQSQTDPKKVHTIDFGKALEHSKAGWRLQSCCTCPSEKVCRHIQNVHEYLFVGKRSMEVYPFINELRMMREEAEDDLRENPNDADAKLRLQKVNHSIEAACVFSDELAKVPETDLKPNLMLDGSSNSIFRKSGGSSTVVESWNDSERKVAQDAVRRMARNFRATKGATSTAQGQLPTPPAPAAASPTKVEVPSTIPTTSPKSSLNKSVASSTTSHRTSGSAKVKSSKRC